MEKSRLSDIMHERVVIPGGSPIRVKWNDFPHFTFPWHFHSEYEIVYIMRSRGTRFVADNMEPFEEGDLVIVGSQVPHYWRNDEHTSDRDENQHVNAIVVQFRSDFLEQALTNYPELGLIKNLLEKSKSGVFFEKSFALTLEPKLKLLYEEKGFNRFILLLQILNEMAGTKKCRQLGTGNNEVIPPDVTDDRLKKIINFINLNYTDKITLEQVASLSGMNPASFTRYFKGKTGKTLVQYINDMRIDYACKLLQNTDYSISRICFETGFNNLSNFNRFFKERMRMTPRDYLRQFMK
ncbi:AraC family transcriptional regulator [Alkalitalea saponilacus]|nr:AraC family transcriptional regulator [Alkalitalea saponilacus]ASB48855.1 AraC family transcriptional regulator [Alkalitalea saponilacus]